MGAKLPDAPQDCPTDVLGSECLALPPLKLLPQLPFGQLLLGGTADEAALREWRDNIDSQLASVDVHGFAGAEVVFGLAMHASAAALAASASRTAPPGAFLLLEPTAGTHEASRYSFCVM